MDLNKIHWKVCKLQARFLNLFANQTQADSLIANNHVGLHARPANKETISSWTQKGQNILPSVFYLKQK